MPASALRLGGFELDPASFQLRRSGRPLRLERIPLEVLLLLVERRGQLVLPQEIAERIWGKDVVLGIDNALNTAIRKVRRALRDDPAHARYVETVPAKGYRFIGANRGERGDEWMFVTHEHNVTCNQAISEVPCLFFIAWSPFMISEDCPPSRRAPCPDHV